MWLQSYGCWRFATCAMFAMQPCHHHSSKSCGAGVTGKLLQHTLRHRKASMPIACLVEMLQGHQHGRFCSGNVCTCTWWTLQTMACSTCELNPTSWVNIVGSKWVVMQQSAALKLLHVLCHTQWTVVVTTSKHAACLMHGATCSIHCCARRDVCCMSLLDVRVQAIHTGA